MTNITIALGLAAALGAAGACWMTHKVARRRRWKRIARYGAGITIINIAFAPVIASALEIEQAAILYGLLWLIGGAAGLSTWACYETEKGAPALNEHDLDKWANAIAGEHRESE